MVGRIFFQVGPFGGVIRVAVFGHPRGARQQFVVALHVEQRHLDDDGAEKFRVFGQHVAHQQAAVAAAVAQTGASGMADMGKVMGVLKTSLAGKADMGEVNKILKAVLSA